MVFINPCGYHMNGAYFGREHFVNPVERER